MDINDEVAQLRAQVRRLTDIEDIKQLTAGYMQAMHDARWEDAVDCFSERASYDHGPLGELADKASIRQFYTEFMDAFEKAGGWAFDILSNPVITVTGDAAEARWFLLTLLIDPDTRQPAWNVATLEYTYTREADGWKFLHNRCVSEHQMVSYAKGLGAQGQSRVTSFTEAEQSDLPVNFERIRAAGGKQAPGKLTRSIRGWTVPTQEPGSQAVE
ncbi:nuclear transport factor 2 family protein [Haliea atlantica]